MRVIIMNNDGEALDIFEFNADDEKLHNQLMNAILDVIDEREPEDQTDAICPCGEPDCSRPYGHL